MTADFLRGKASGLRLAAILLRWGGYRSRAELFHVLWETAETTDAAAHGTEPAAAPGTAALVASTPSLSAPRRTA